MPFWAAAIIAHAMYHWSNSRCEALCPPQAHRHTWKNVLYCVGCSAGLKDATYLPQHVVVKSRAAQKQRAFLATYAPIRVMINRLE